VPEAFDDLREPGEQSAVAEEGTTFAVDGEGEAWIVAEAAEPAEAENVEEGEDVEDAEARKLPRRSREVDAVDAVVPVFAEPDETAVAIERPPPATESSGETQQPPVEVFATGPNDLIEVVIRHMSRLGRGARTTVSVRGQMDWMSRRCSPDSANVPPQ